MSDLPSLQEKLVAARRLREACCAWLEQQTGEGRESSVGEVCMVTTLLTMVNCAVNLCTLGAPDHARHVLDVLFDLREKQQHMFDQQRQEFDASWQRPDE